MRESGAPVQKGKTSGQDARLGEFLSLCTTIDCPGSKISSPPEMPARPRALHEIMQTRAAHRQSAAPGPSSEAADYASTSTGLQAALQGHIWDLMAGEVCTFKTRPR